MKALVFRVGQPPVVEDVDGFRGIQLAVGGYIERVVLVATRDMRKGVALWCDEDGISKGLTPNVYAIGELYAGGVIHGTAVVIGFGRTKVGTAEEDEVEVDLTAEEIARWGGLPRCA